MKKKLSYPAHDMPDGEVNIIPIVDVSFVLVIFCMATMNLILSAGINVLETRPGAAAGKAALKENVSIMLTQDSKIFIGNKEIKKDNLFHELLKFIPNTKDKMVIISADAETRCEDVVDVLDISKKSGAKRLALVQIPE